jgi:hypothetical protein
MNPKPLLWLLTAIFLVCMQRAEAEQQPKQPKIGRLDASDDILD